MRSLRQNLMVSWALSCLVAYLLQWAALNAPPVAEWLLGELNAVVRSQGYAALLWATSIVQGAVFFLLVNFKALHNVFTGLHNGES